MKSSSRAYVLTSVFVAALLALSAGGGSAQQNFGPWGVDLTARDQKVKPGDDFFEYANGGWLARTPIPADQASASAGRDIFNLTQDQLRALIETSAANATTPTAAQIGGLYKSFMDEAAVEALDAKPLAKDLAAIQAVTSKPEFATLMAQTASNVGASVFALQPYADAKKPSHDALSRAGRPRPARPRLLPDGQVQPTRSRRTRPIIDADASRWPGRSGAAGKAKDVLAFETKIAEASWPAAERRDIDKTYNPMTVAELQAYAPGSTGGAAIWTAPACSGLANVVVAENTRRPEDRAALSQTRRSTR